MKNGGKRSSQYYTVCTGIPKPSSRLGLGGHSPFNQKRKSAAENADRKENQGMCSNVYFNTNSNLQRLMPFTERTGDREEFA